MPSIRTMERTLHPSIRVAVPSSRGGSCRISRVPSLNVKRLVEERNVPFEMSFRPERFPPLHSDPHFSLSCHGSESLVNFPPTFVPHHRIVRSLTCPPFLLPPPHPTGDILGSSLPSHPPMPPFSYPQVESTEEIGRLYPYQKGCWIILARFLASSHRCT